MNTQSIQIGCNAPFFTKSGAEILPYDNLKSAPKVLTSDNGGYFPKTGKQLAQVLQALIDLENASSPNKSFHVVDGGRTYKFDDRNTEEVLDYLCDNCGFAFGPLCLEVFDPVPWLPDLPTVQYYRVNFRTDLAGHLLSTRWENLAKSAESDYSSLRNYRKRNSDGDCIQPRALCGRRNPHRFRVLLRI